MTSALAAKLFDILLGPILKTIEKQVTGGIEGVFRMRLIEAKVRGAVATFGMQIAPFFENEGLGEDKLDFLLTICSSHLQQIAEQPALIFAGSMNGRKIFDLKFKSGLPQEIRDEGLEDIFSKIFPHLANLLCSIPPIVEQWKLEGFKENFRRFDEVIEKLGLLVGLIEGQEESRGQLRDSLFSKLKASLLQQVEFQIELAGLRGARPDAVPLDACFVEPRVHWSVQKHDLHLEDLAPDHWCPNMVITGPAGSGKSTWARWLQRKLLYAPGNQLCLLIKLRDLYAIEQLPSITDMIREAAGIHLREEVTAEIVRTWCGSQAIVIIFDGFDEIPPESRDSYMKWCTDGANFVHPCPVLLTSRPLATTHIDELRDIWRHYEVMPFGLDRITEYIGKWYKSAPLLAEDQRYVDSLSLASSWFQDVALQPLVGTPLMLATIMMVHHLDGELPKGRSRLYERYIEGMLGVWDSRRGVRSSAEVAQQLKKKILTKLALRFQLDKVEQLGDAEIRDRLDEMLPDLGVTLPVDSLLDHLRERSGLLVGPGTWSFSHKNIGEFLVAQAIVDGDQKDALGTHVDRHRLFASRQDDRWASILLFWAGLCSVAELQEFIVDCMRSGVDKDRVLALLLVSEQIDPSRLDSRWKKEVVLNALSVGLPMSAGRVGKGSTFSLFFHDGGFILGPDCEIPHAEDWLWDGVSELCIRCGITFAEVSASHPSIRNYCVERYFNRFRSTERPMITQFVREKGLPAINFLVHSAIVGYLEGSSEAESISQLKDIIVENFPEQLGLTEAIVCSVGNIYNLPNVTESRLADYLETVSTIDAVAIGANFAGALLMKRPHESNSGVLHNSIENISRHLDKLPEGLKPLAIQALDNLRAIRKHAELLVGDQ